MARRRHGTVSRAHRKVHRGRRKKGNWFTRLSMGKRIAVCAGGVLLCAVASGAIFVAAKLAKLDTQEIDADDIYVNKEVEDQDLGSGYLNVALFGTDSRDGGMDKGTRSDCIIVASLNKETKEIRMVSVYRDTLLDIEDGQLQKCNAAYAFGGPTQAINMLNKNLDLDIQEYVTVDWGAIAEAIDLLGGVEIDVKEEEVKYLNKFVKETAKAAGKKAHKVKKAGTQTLDGVQATTYARIRSTAGGDFTRTERQRLVVEKIVEKVQQSDLATLNKMIDQIFPTIKTSFSIKDIVYYAQSFTKYKLTENAGFPFDKTTDTISGLGSIVIPVTLESNVAELHKFLFDKADYSPSSTVTGLSSAIVTRVGDRSATDDSQLMQQTYTTTEEDRQIEQTTPEQYEESSNSGSGSGSSSGGGSESGGGSGSGGGGGTNKPSNSGNDNNKPSTGGGTSTEKPSTKPGGGETGGNESGGEPTTPTPDPEPTPSPDPDPSEGGSGGSGSGESGSTDNSAEQ